MIRTIPCKEDFDSYYNNLQTIQRLKNDDCVVSDSVKGSSPEPPYTAHKVRVQGVDRVRKSRNDRIIAMLTESCQRVESAVERAPNTYIKLLLTLKYIDGLDWADVAAVVDKSPDACRKTVTRYFESR